MKNERTTRIRSDAVTIFKEAIRAVDPYNAVKRFVRIEGNRLTVGTKDLPNTEIDLADYERIFLVGGGKATAPMAKAVEELLGKRIFRGMINVKYGFSTELTFTRITEANHPLPDANGVEGTRKMLELLNSAGEKDLVFSLISGGGSALLVHPAGDISMEEIQELTQMLLECGATIDEINSLRKHISSIKGGRMAQAAYPATTVNLMLSDVVGDNMDVIASGPFVPDRSTFKDAWKVIEKYNLKKHSPSNPILFTIRNRRPHSRDPENWRGYFPPGPQFRHRQQYPGTQGRGRKSERSGIQPLGIVFHDRR